MAKNRRRKLKLLKGEKVLYSTTLLIVFLFMVFTVCSKTTFSELNIEVERLKGTIATQENKNDSLVMKVNELASLENINSVAVDLGLSYNNQNIKTIAVEAKSYE